jgi:AraC family transcriptional regulator
VYPIAIHTMPNMRVAALPHRGPYPQIGAVFAQISREFDAAGLWGAVIGPAIGLYYDDPSQTRAADLRAHAGMIVSADAVLPANLEEIHLPAGRYAVLRYVGPYTGLPAAWHWLYQHWLPESGESLAETPPFELNPNSPMDTPPEKLITDICVKLL